MTKAHSSALRRAGLGFATVLATLVGAGCIDPITDEPAKEGELGVGNFLYRCVGDSDWYCDEGGTAENFPEAIAVGGRFNLDYNQDIDGVVPRVKSGSDAIINDGNALLMARAGYAVVLAVEGFGDVIDLLHISGRDVTRIAVTTMDSQDLETIELAPGDRIELVARPQDDLRTTLGGALDYTWSSDDEAVFEIASADLDESVEIEAVAPGTAMLMVSTGEFTQMIPVEVEGDAGTTGDTEGMTDDATDGDTDDDTDGTTGGETDDSGESTDDTTDGGSTDDSTGGDTDGSTSDSSGGETTGDMTTGGSEG